MAHVMGGVHGLSHEAAHAFWRDAQHTMVPTTTLRGVCGSQEPPESLEFLSNMLLLQTGDRAHDTQVLAREAVGHPCAVDNVNAKRLKACDMGGLLQTTHHWSPLLHETKVVETKRDQDRCVYLSPKDRHVFPWIDNLIRFGTIQPRYPE